MNARLFARPGTSRSATLFDAVHRPRALSASTSTRFSSAARRTPARNASTRGWSSLACDHTLSFEPLLAFVSLSQRVFSGFDRLHLQVVEHRPVVAHPCQGRFEPRERVTDFRAWGRSSAARQPREALAPTTTAIDTRLSESRPWTRSPSSSYHHQLMSRPIRWRRREIVVGHDQVVGRRACQQRLGHPAQKLWLRGVLDRSRSSAHAATETRTTRMSYSSSRCAVARSLGRHSSQNSYTSAALAQRESEAELIATGDQRAEDVGHLAHCAAHCLWRGPVAHRRVGRCAIAWPPTSWMNANACSMADRRSSSRAPSGALRSARYSARA